MGETDPISAVVVLSGGMDSTTALYKAHVDGFDNIYAISFNYGQRHKVELEHAKEITDKADFVKDHKIVDLSSITSLIDNSSLTGEEVVPEGHYAAENMKSTVVPNRNMIMYSIAIGYAINVNARAIYAGIHAGDHPIYPDCRPAFASGLQDLARVANEGYIHSNFLVMAPFVNIGKHNIVEIGSKLNVPYELTWSCYKGGDKHCGRCGTCVERKEAFRLAGVDDPTEYIDPISDLEIAKE